MNNIEKVKYENNFDDYDSEFIIKNEDTPIYDKDHVKNDKDKNNN